MGEVSADEQPVKSPVPAPKDLSLRATVVLGVVRVSSCFMYMLCFRFMLSHYGCFMSGAVLDLGIEVARS
ncbi:hypothetical protein V8E55_000951 [Tylopilus felleus]